jgi:gluconolactonase
MIVAAASMVSAFAVCTRGGSAGDASAGTGRDVGSDTSAAGRDGATEEPGAAAGTGGAVAGPDGGAADASASDAGTDATDGPPADAGAADLRADAVSRAEAGPNRYQGTVPAPGTPVPLGNTKIFDDSTGVAWNQSAGELLFTVDQINHIWRYRPGVTTNTNMGFDIVRRGGEDVFGFKGIAFAPDEALIVCETRVHRVTRSFPGYDTPVVLVDRAPGGDGSPGGRFNSPNDVVVRDDGNIYFTDPVLGTAKSPDLDFQGIYRIDPSGQVSLVVRDLEPWAVALSADHDTLFVSTGNHRDARAAGIYKFPILADGRLGPRSLFASGSVAGPPGGLCVDQAGNVYHAFLGLKVFGPDGARRNVTIDVPGATDCAFGGADLKTLFVTAGSRPAVYNLFAVPLNVPGVP